MVNSYSATIGFLYFRTFGFTFPCDKRFCNRTSPFFRCPIPYTGFPTNEKM